MAFEDVVPTRYDFGYQLVLNGRGLKSLEGLQSIRNKHIVTMLVLYLNNLSSLTDSDIGILRGYSALKFINLSMCNIEMYPEELSRIRRLLPGVKVIVGHRSFGGSSIQAFKEYWATKGVYLEEGWK